MEAQEESVFHLLFPVFSPEGFFPLKDHLGVESPETAEDLGSEKVTHDLSCWSFALICVKRGGFSSYTLCEASVLLHRAELLLRSQKLTPGTEASLWSSVRKRRGPLSSGSYRCEPYGGCSLLHSIDQGCAAVQFESTL